RPRHRGGRPDRARSSAAARRRQHVRDAVSLPTDRMGRRHRRALRDEVHRRTWHEHRRRRRRVGPVQLGERTLFGDRGSVAGVSRTPVLRNVWDVRLPDEAARRDVTRSRRLPEPVQRVPVSAGARDAVAADGTARRDRSGCRGIPGLARARDERDVRRIEGEQVSTSRRQVLAARRRRGVFVRLRRRTDGGTGFDPRRQRLVASRERRRFEEPDHSPRQHNASSAERGRTDGRRRRTGHDSAVGRRRIDRRLDLGSRTGVRARESRRGGGGRVAMSFDVTRYQDPLVIQRILHSAKTIAIVGLSKNHLRASYFVGYYLRRHGYHIIPVNPREKEILGQPSVASLTDITVPVDVVNVFRAPDALPEIARDAVAIKAKALWCQYSVINEEGARIAEAGGVDVVMDRCMKVEHARYVGRMHWLGFNTQRITSVRGGL